MLEKDCKNAAWWNWCQNSPWLKRRIWTTDYWKIQPERRRNGRENSCALLLRNEPEWYIWADKIISIMMDNQKQTIAKDKRRKRIEKLNLNPNRQTGYWVKYGRYYLKAGQKEGSASRPFADRIGRQSRPFKALWRKNRLTQRRSLGKGEKWRKQRSDLNRSSKCFSASVL